MDMDKMTTLDWITWTIGEIGQNCQLSYVSLKLKKVSNSRNHETLRLEFKTLKHRFVRSFKTFFLALPALQAEAKEPLVQKMH